MLRIVGGRYRGQRLAAPRGRQTRPTSELVREGIFNTLAAWVDWEQACVLDLFAGSGALGIEALSRGARQATFIEGHARTAAGIRANLAKLGVPEQAARVVVARAESWLKGSHAVPPAALVLMDPPYAFAGYEAVLALLCEAPQVAPGAIIVVEADKRRALELPAGLAPLRTKRYGDTQVWFLAKADRPLSPPPSEALP